VAPKLLRKISVSSSYHQEGQSDALNLNDGKLHWMLRDLASSFLVLVQKIDLEWYRN